MQIITKRIRIIQMTTEEIEKFHELMEQAKDGRMQHYAEDRLADGSFLGVAVVSRDEQERELVRRRQIDREQRMMKRGL